MITIDIRKFVRDRDWIGFAFDQTKHERLEYSHLEYECVWYYRCDNTKARRALSQPIVTVITFIIKMLNRIA